MSLKAARAQAALYEAMREASKQKKAADNGMATVSDFVAGLPKADADDRVKIANVGVAILWTLREELGLEELPDNLIGSVVLGLAAVYGIGLQRKNGEVDALEQVQPLQETGP